MAEFGVAGMYWNATFDAVWGLCLIAALALNRLPSVSRITGARLRLAIVAGYLAVPAAVVAGNASIHWSSPRFWIDPRWSEAASSAREIEFLSAHVGPALCENLALCYWAAKPAEVDFFNMRERIHRDPWREDELLRLVEARRFSVAQIDGLFDLGPRFDDALKRNYRLDHRGRWGSLFVPR